MLMKKIASLRKEINELIITDRNSERLQELSRELDKLIIEFYARKNDSA
ncbi:MAG: aspartyl-phosphate phosphatase Spo0E family protein [Alkaliphilus sp.]